MRSSSLFALVVVGCPLSLVGCGGGAAQELAALKAQRADVSAMTFTTSTTIAANAPPTLDLRVDDASRAQAAYAATLALPAFPDGTFNCPVDFGVIYHAAYLDAKGATVLATDMDPNGCEDVTLSDTSIPQRWAANTATFWQQLAQSLGIDESQIHPYFPPLL